VTTLSQSRPLRLATLCVLYFAQGVPYGFVAITLRAFFTAGGMSPETLGMFIAIAHAPWAFKPAWAPIIDTLRMPSLGQRRPWILVAQVMMTLTVAAMLTIDELAAEIVLLGWLVAIHNTFSALQDVATDAMAIELLHADEQGRANGFMYGSKVLGAAVGGSGLAHIADSYSMSMALVMLTAMMCAAAAFPAVVRERPGDRLFPWSPGKTQAVTSDTSTRLATLFFGLPRAFSMRSTVLGGAFAVGAYLGAGVLSIVGAVLYIERLGWSKTMHADWTTWGMVVGVFGSILGGWAADRIGPRRVMAIATCCLGGSWVVFGLSQQLWSQQWFAGGLIVVEAVFLYALTAGALALFMRLSWPVVAATQFTIYMALFNFSTTVGSGLGGWLSAHVSYPTLFVTAGLLQCALLLVLPWIDVDQTARELGPQSA